MKTFDRRLGKQTLSSLPTTPGVYRFYDEAGTLIYVGKAKNLRRRLSQYRNAKRCKAHAKMRKIVADAKQLEFETCETEFHALALENSWIQQKRPKWNVAGAFFFLYPMVGVCVKNGQLFLSYTTSPEKFPGFSYHGAYRSRVRTRECFFSLIELLRLIGHPIARPQIVKSGLAGIPTKHSYVYGFRQIPEEWQTRLEGFFRGDSFEPIEELSLLLLDRPTALKNAAETQEHLKTIRRFWRHEIRPLKLARDRTTWKTYPVEQKDRDLIFIALRSRKASEKSQAPVVEVPQRNPA